MKLKLITHFLRDDLLQATEKSETVYWVVSFLKRTGAKAVIHELQKAHDRGAEIKLLFGDYLHITEPEALQLLFRKLPNAQIRLFQSNGRSFHPKSYLFRSSSTAEIFVGSSNLSQAALTDAVEWNIHATLQKEHVFFEEVAAAFIELFTHPDTIPVNEETIRRYNKRYQQENAKLNIGDILLDDDHSIDYPTLPTKTTEVVREKKQPLQLTPRPAQQMALNALEDMRKKGYDKGLVVLATGLGKTYLAAFFAASFERILFIAHREELLVQAKEAFQALYPERSAGLYNGKNKVNDAEMTFASIQTFASRYHLQQFDRDDFDLIIIDEFHHAVAPSYQEVLQHFQPSFWLGITATPERLDNQDVYALCDGNVAISIHFIEAIQNQWLSPIVYYGVFDETNYDEIAWQGKRYDREQLIQKQLHKNYAKGVFDAWEKRKQTRTIAFCSSVKQAEYLSTYFQQQGVRSLALSGQTPSSIRQNARQALNDGILDIIFTVDLFNEGVDIPKVDTLLFVRPTESLAVFTQQLGRGLRLAEEKEHCVVIDLIGNYRNVTKKFSALTQNLEQPVHFDEASLSIPGVIEFDFETEVVDLLETMKKMSQTKNEQLIERFYDLIAELGRRPTYLDMHLLGPSTGQYIRREFRSYPQFLLATDHLTKEEREVAIRYASWFEEINQTKLSKSYKLVVLYCLLTRDKELWMEPITAKQVAPCFYRFFTENTNRYNIEWTENQQNEFIPFNEKKLSTLIKDMPMTHLAKHKNSHFLLQGDTLSIHLPIHTNEDHALVYEWTKQIVEQRLHEYFENK